jgi:hypothetical protein
MSAWLCAIGLHFYRWFGDEGWVCRHCGREGL